MNNFALPISEAFMAKKEEILRLKLVLRKQTTAKSENVFMPPVNMDSVSIFGAERILPSNQGNLRNSIDFYVPSNTPVLAAADGVVVGACDDYKAHGTSTRYWKLGNYVDIKHENDEFTWYEHLAYRAVMVRYGDRVRRGQTIALSDNTGFSEKPHLHFQVNKYFGDGYEDYVTLRARFPAHFKELNKVYSKK